MMIPPVVRLGYPTEPQPNRVGYICLVRHYGWVELNWAAHLGFYREEVLYPGSNGLVDVHQYKPEDILCWMPQDGT